MVNKLNITKLVKWGEKYINPNLVSYIGEIRIASDDEAYYMFSFGLDGNVMTIYNEYLDKITEKRNKLIQLVQNSCCYDPLKPYGLN